MTALAPGTRACTRVSSRSRTSVTGFRAAVEARLPKTRRGRPGYAEDDTPQTIEQATEINEDALRYYGIPAGALATSAECGDGVRGSNPNPTFTQPLRVGAHLVHAEV